MFLIGNSVIMTRSLRLVARSQSHNKGFAHVAMAPVIVVLLLFLAGAIKVVNLAHQRIGTQSRLDICAVGLTTTRKKWLSEISRTNKAIKGTLLAVYAARGIKIIAGPAGGIAATLGEKALINTNHGLAKYQEILLVNAAAQETQATFCANTPFSKDLVYCSIQPNSLTALRREKALFPDLKGELIHKNSSTFLAKIQCQNQKLSTAINIKGDPTLRKGALVDQYEK